MIFVIIIILFDVVLGSGMMYDHTVYFAISISFMQGGIFEAKSI